MDTITHGIVGALTGKALFSGRELPAMSHDGALSREESSSTARAAIVACTIGSIFPDIDIFAGTLGRNPLAIMEWHRNISHSLVLLPVWAALLAALSLPLARWLGWKTPSYPKLFAIYAIGLATHVFLDVVTNFGTMVWSPLRYTRVAWDWLFILDLTLTSVALLPQLAAWCYRDPLKFRLRTAGVWATLTAGAFGAYALAGSAGYPFPIAVVGIVSALFAMILFVPSIRGTGFSWRRASWCRAGLALVCAYLGLASGMHRKALADVNRFATTHQLPLDNFAAMPLPPTITHWAGLVSTPGGVWRATFHEPEGQIERTQFYSDPPPDRYVAEAKRLRDVQVYLWFARFPVWQEMKERDQTIVDISDVRFFREQDPNAKLEGQQTLRLPGVRPNPVGFTFEVVFDSKGNVLSSGLKKTQP
jgi:membrane-bound metal-dependent hydrolase YbcI (DUF457 family)